MVAKAAKVNGCWQFGKDSPLEREAYREDGRAVIEVEIQNENRQTQERIRFAAVPRIGEGIRLREPDGFWASYDVLDVWYQKADYGDVWVPYLHVRMTPSEGEIDAANDAQSPEREVVPFKI